MYNSRIYKNVNPHCDVTSNKKKIVTFCSYIPEEIIYAAGLIPKRMISDKELPTGDNSMLPPYMCSYAIKNLNLLLDSQKDYDGIIFTNSCHAMENIFEIMQKKRKDINTFCINVPKKLTSAALNFFLVELEKFKYFLENTYLTKITPQKLNKAIKIYNLKRQIRNNIEKLIIDSRLYLSAAEIHSLNIKFFEKPKIYIKYAEKIINKESFKNNEKYRIMLTGSIYSPQDIIEVIERHGGAVVLCDFCNAARSSPAWIEESKKPLKSIAEGYLNKLPCARQCDLSARINIFQKNLDTYKIQGVVFSTLKFCPDHAYNSVIMTKILQELNIPFLVLDSEYETKSSGQIHTRVQAFFENL